MPQFSIQLAQNRILVNALFDSTKEFCKEYLCESEGADFSVSITPERQEAYELIEPYIANALCIVVKE